MHIVTVDVTPGIDPAAFAAQPKGLYRIGSDRMRIEEASDPANGIHGLIVVSEPNIWMANLFDNTGKHVVDPGPSFLAIAPVFGIEGLSAKLLGLEMGCEPEFIATYIPAPVRSEQIGGMRFDVYRLADTSDSIEILERSGTRTPAFARYYHQDKLTVVLRYDLYETGLPNNPNLFVPPPGVHYAEAGH